MRHNLNEKLVRTKLVKYLTGTKSLRAFRRWFVPATWDIGEGAPVGMRKLVYEIKLRLAEYSNGHWSESELRAKLLSVASWCSAGEDEHPRVIMSSGYTNLNEHEQS